MKKIKIKIMALLLATVMFVLSSVTVWAYEIRVNYNGFICNMTADDNVILYQYTGNESVIDHDDWHYLDSLYDKRIARIEDGAFKDNSKLIDITLPSTVTYIGPNAFKNCKNLKYIYIPEGVKSIGANAFAGCTSLKKIIYGGSKYEWSVIEKIGLGISPSSYNVTCYTVKNHFVDVNPSDYFHDPVVWAYHYDITTGTSETKFSPDEKCTRAQIVTFLWRMANSPSAAGKTCPFVDVVKGSYYYDAVVWAYNSGCITGKDATHFDPDGFVKRCEFVTILYRNQGKPYESYKEIFSDVDASEYYADAVMWAFSHGITSGMGNGLFAPNEVCTRGQSVTFLYRYNENYRWV